MEIPAYRMMRFGMLVYKDASKQRNGDPSLQNDEIWKVSELFGDGSTKEV
jgi:hypothetical protein